MNLRICLLVTCLLTVGITRARSQNKEIESNIEHLNEAIISKDKSVLEILTADELSYGHSTAVFQNKSEFVNDVLSGPTSLQKIDVTNQTISLADNIAIVRNTCTITGTTKGGPLNLKIGVLMIWRKQGDVWKLLARQGFKLP
jgi:ketosteroid isomerase-like protein